MKKLSQWLVLAYGFWVLICPLIMFLSLHSFGLEQIPTWYAVSWFLSILLVGPLLGLVVARLEKGEKR